MSKKDSTKKPGLKVQKLWGERFGKESPQRLIDFLSDRDVQGVRPCDEALIPYDLWGSKAHTIMLWKQGIISKEDCRDILSGLKDVEALHTRGRFKLEPSKEDVHSNVESVLIERFGIESVGKMHTGRSRNDQVALDMRLYLRDQVLGLVDHLTTLLETASTRARRHLRTVMPGFTHHQHAMITTFGHMLMGLAIPLERDLERLMNWYRLFNQNPLGGVAGYGTSFPLDRHLTSRLLAFDGPQGHSTDPITNRWEPEADLAFAISVTMNHLSAMAQTFILMSTTEFGMIRLDDIHCSGSSIMPQKRNPDPLEVMKAKASLAHGFLTSLVSIGKDCMVGYNRESQWTKYLIMDVLSECAPVPVIMAEIIDLMEVNEPAMAKQAGKGFITATHLLEAIVKHADLPFRQAKVLVERAVRYAEEAGREEVALADLNRAMGEMDLHVQLKTREIAKWQDPSRVLEEGGIVEGPSPLATRESISSLAKRLREYGKWRRDQSLRIQGALREIESTEKSLGIGPEPS